MRVSLLNVNLFLFQVSESNTWFHVAVTFENNVFKLYIDGVLTATQEYSDPGIFQLLNVQTPSFLGVAPLNVPAASSSSIHFNGCMDDVSTEHKQSQSINFTMRCLYEVHQILIFTSNIDKLTHTHL